MDQKSTGPGWNDPVTRRSFLYRAGGTAFATTALAGFLAACGGGSSGGGAGSTSSGNLSGALRLRAFDGYYNKDATKAFRKQNPDVTIKASIPMSPEEILSSLNAPGGTARWDALTTPIFQTSQLASLDLLEPLDLDRLPNTQGYLPIIKQSVKENGATYEGKTNLVPFAWGVNTAVYNSKYVKPTSWMDFTEPEYTNKLAMWDSPLDNYNAWGRVLGFEPPTMSQEELDEVTDFLVDFKKEQVRTFTISYDDMSDQLARGDIIAISNPSWVGIALDANERAGNDDCVFDFFDEPGGSLLWIDGWGIPSGSKNVDAAYAFINDQLGPKPQSIYAPAMAVAPVNKKAVDLLPPADRKRDAYLFEDEFLNRKSVVPYQYPIGEVTYQDWLKAWSRVQAA